MWPYKNALFVETFEKLKFVGWRALPRNIHDMYGDGITYFFLCLFELLQTFYLLLWQKHIIYYGFFFLLNHVRIPSSFGEHLFKSFGDDRAM